MFTDFAQAQVRISSLAKDDAAGLLFREKLLELLLREPLSNAPCCTCLDIAYFFVYAAPFPIAVEATKSS